MEHINSLDKSAYPPLDRTAFLIEHACVPSSIPSCHPEAAQVLAAMAERFFQNHPQENSDGK